MGGDSTCLNRTSVGLKVCAERCGHSGIDGPQSNQRGIESTSPHPHGNGMLRGLNRTSVGLKVAHCWVGLPA